IQGPMVRSRSGQIDPFVGIVLDRESGLHVLFVTAQAPSSDFVPRAAALSPVSYLCGLRGVEHGVDHFFAERHAIWQPAAADPRGCEIHDVAAAKFLQAPHATFAIALETGALPPRYQIP